MPNTFDSKQYSWSDLSIVMGGRIVTGATAVEYTKKQEKELLYGRGNTPHKITRGNRSCEGKLTLWQSELEAMIRDAKDKDILKLNFDLVVSYVPEDGGQTVVDILKGCEFTEVKKGMAQGDKNMSVELPIIFLDVKPQS
ncbi:hypothetical protein ACFOWU_10070 [Epilithonimonas zeae]|uniref:Phage tail protein n=1 Tax=Epilithonimonas zeae TaxID=1416779 RepID=A0A1N6GWF2_9FLAO|nr:hypothetical protein [Epilithonimonas zeae]SIO11869.1 hypothetical protein SAMN05444409_2098 [Epilithonimonas zeae]